MQQDSYSHEQQRRDARAARKGDREAFGRLYDHLFPRLYGYVAHRVGTKEDAEDVVAETWLRAVRKLEQFEGGPGGSFSGWIFQIARNLVADHHRRGRPEFATPLEELDRVAGTNPWPQHFTEHGDRQRRIQAVIRTLSPRRQEVVILRYFGGLRNREIAELLGLDERTIASHLSRALSDLQERFVQESL